MKSRILRLVLVTVVVFSLRSTAYGVDDGQTQPKLSRGAIHSGMTASDVVALTNGSGNVKGVACSSASATALSNATIQIYVNGGAAQTLAMSNTAILVDAAQTYYTGYIPMNVRFGTSIRVRMTGTAWTEVDCSASWALD